MIRTHQTEFPEIEIPQALLTLVESGVLTDSTGRNDICPSFTYFDHGAASENQSGYRLWADHQIADCREYVVQARFAVYLTHADGSPIIRPLLVTDDIDEVLGFILWYLAHSMNTAVNPDQECSRQWEEQLKVRAHPCWKIYINNVEFQPRWAATTPEQAVSDIRARYALPDETTIMATPANDKAVEFLRQREEEQRRRELVPPIATERLRSLIQEHCLPVLRKTAVALQDAGSTTVEISAHGDGRLREPLPVRAIADALRKHLGVEALGLGLGLIVNKYAKLPEIKELGLYSLELVLHETLSVPFKLWVVPVDPTQPR